MTVPSQLGDITANGLGLSGIPSPLTSAIPSSYDSSFQYQVVLRLNSLIGALRTSDGWGWQIPDRFNKLRSDVITIRDKVNEYRTSTQQTSAGLGNAVDYAEDAGGAALNVASSTADAVVKATPVAKIQGLSIRALPGEAGNVAGYKTLQEANNAISLWLEHRTYWMGEIHAALNRMLAYRGLTLCPAIGTALWDMTSLGDNWSAIVARWQANDDWFNNAATIMRPRIQTLWTNEDLGTPTYPSVTLAWADRGTFAASREDAAASLRAHHSYYTSGLGTAVVKPIRVANGDA